MEETQLSKSQKVQTQAMRIILQYDRYTKVNYILQVLQFMSIRQELYYNMYIYF